jgi:hypothetical protein
MFFSQLRIKRIVLLCGLMSNSLAFGRIQCDICRKLVVLEVGSNYVGMFKSFAVVMFVCVP